MELINKVNNTYDGGTAEALVEVVQGATDMMIDGCADSKEKRRRAEADGRVAEADVKIELDEAVVQARK